MFDTVLKIPLYYAYTCSNSKRNTYDGFLLLVKLQCGQLASLLKTELFCETFQNSFSSWHLLVQSRLDIIFLQTFKLLLLQTNKLLFLLLLLLLQTTRSNYYSCSLDLKYVPSRQQRYLNSFLHLVEKKNVYS